MSNEEQEAVCSIIFNVLRDNPFLLDMADVQCLIESKQVVKIGGLNFKVELIQYGENAGEYDYGKRTIRVKKELVMPQVFESLMHEIIHGVFRVLCLFPDIKKEKEHDIELLSFFVCALLGQNDMSWMKGENNE